MDLAEVVGSCLGDMTIVLCHIVTLAHVLLYNRQLKGDSSHVIETAVELSRII